jgi:hypothetical protein
MGRLRLKCDCARADFVFRRNGLVHLNRRGLQSTTGSRGVRISGSNAGYTMFRGSMKSTGYLLHSPVSTSLPLPCVTVCHHISTELYRAYFPGRGVDYPLPSSAEVEERVELYLCSPSVPLLRQAF